MFIHNAYVLGTLHRHEVPCALDLHWIEANARRDLDNVSFAIKFIQDALVEKGVFPDDSRKYIQDIHHSVETRKNEYGVIVKIKEI